LSIILERHLGLQHSYTLVATYGQILDIEYIKIDIPLVFVGDLRAEI